MSKSRESQAVRHICETLSDYQNWTGRLQAALGHQLSHEWHARRIVEQITAGAPLGLSASCFPSWREKHERAKIIKSLNLWEDSRSVTPQPRSVRSWLGKYHWRWWLIVEGLDCKSCISYSKLHIGSSKMAARQLFVFKLSKIRCTFSPVTVRMPPLSVWDLEDKESSVVCPFNT